MGTYKSCTLLIEEIRNICTQKLLIFSFLFLAQLFISFPAYAVITVSDTGAADINRGIAYDSIIVSASGGSGSYTYSVSAGALLAGLSLNTSTGTVSGTPMQAGAFSYTVQVSDGFTTATQVISSTIAAPAMVLSPSALLQIQAGTAYNQTLVASGGTAPYAYTVSAGALPAGLSLNATTGALTGTPTTAGAYNFTINATDSSTGTGAPFFASRAYTGTVANPTLVLSSSFSAISEISHFYSQTNTASGGSGSYTYSISAGALPAGLSLNTGTGTVSGTPTEAGPFSYTVQVSDGATTATQVISSTIAAPEIVLNPSVLPEPQVGMGVSIARKRPSREAV